LNWYPQEELQKYKFVVGMVLKYPASFNNFMFLPFTLAAPLLTVFIAPFLLA